MIDFFNRMFGRQSSGATAKERLRLVLMSDHLSLAPDMIDAMKRDLVDVISRYVEVDRDRIEVNFEHQDKALAMLANIPITGVNRNANGSSGEAATTSPIEPQEASTVDAPRTSNGQRRRRRRKSAQSGAAAQPAPAAPAT